MSTKAMHISGPWVMDAPGCVAKHWPEAGKRTICTTPYELPADLANARLIVAAPELLEALQSVVRNSNGTIESGFMDIPASTIVNAKAAIAKALGE